jgi:hypothetical protein
MAASLSIAIFKIFALLTIISDKSFSEYSSNLCIIPNLSLKGEESEPALVVAPIKVN